MFRFSLEIVTGLHFDFTGQKPYPCPQCESFFSTKSNCERHLLRKHGVSNRALQNNGSRPKPKADEGSRGSTGTFGQYHVAQMVSCV